MHLNIVTPLARAENFPALYENVSQYLNRKGPVKVFWWVVVDPKSNFTPTIFHDNIYYVASVNSEATAGHAHRNQVLDFLQYEGKDTWFMSLDDDNILHPDLILYLSWLLEWERTSLQGKVGILFDQCWKDGTKRLIVEKDNIGLNRTDTAQFILKVSAIGEQRFNETRYDADGLFIYEFYEKHKKDILHINKDLCYYNYLR